MKSIVFKSNLFIIFCLGIISLHAQKIEFGVHVGLTHSKMIWADKIENNPFSFIQYPETQFRTSYGIGLLADYHLSSKFYIPIQVDFYNKRFSVSTGGRVDVIDDNGQHIAIMTDYLDYSINQLGFSIGLGYKIINHLSLEVHPYYHLSFGKEKIKIAEVIDWREDVNFQQDYDFGLSGYLKGNFKRLYVKAGYQYGLKRITEYSVFDANGAPVGKFPIRNTMFLLIFGSTF